MRPAIVEQRPAAGEGASPGSHPLIRAAWLAAAAIFVLAAAVGVLGRAGRPAALLAAGAAALLVVGYLAHLARHLLFVRQVQRAEAALRRGELETARTILAPLLERHGGLALLQRAAGLTLYPLGDPLSAATLLERAARSFADDPELATTLVASYAALNRAGDARRAAALAPRHPDVRLALAWSELVALGGDREAGAAIVADLRERADVRSDAARRAMAAALTAVAVARAPDEAAVAYALREAREASAGLPAFDRAFLGYLEGAALRELGRRDAAIAAFDRARGEAAGTIGEALATRERANLLAQAPSSLQPSAEPSSSAKSSGS